MLILKLKSNENQTRVHLKEIFLQGIFQTNVDTPTKETNKFLVKRSTYSTKETSKTSVKPSSSTKETRKAPNKRVRSEQGGLRPLLAKANKMHQQSIRQEEEIDKNKGRSLYYQFNFEVCNSSGYGRGLGKKIN